MRELEVIAMLKMFKGCEVPCAEKLNNEYEVLGDNMLNANADVDKVAPILLDFAELHADEPVYFFLELPPEYRSEMQVSSGQNIIGEDNETYYIDGMSTERVRVLLAQYGELLINDGISRFGLGGNLSNDQLIVDKYNVLNLFAQELEPVQRIFEKHGLKQVENLLTAWDTFTEEEPGVCTRYTQEDVDVFALPALLNSWGIYLLNIRPDE